MSTATAAFQVLQAAAGAGRTVIDVDRDLEEQEAQRSAKQITRDQLLARVNDLRHATHSLDCCRLPSVGAACCTGSCQRLPFCNACLQGRGNGEHKCVA